MARVVVGGALANKPRNGGEAWVRLSWILALQELGFEVLFVEQLSTEACVDDEGAPAPFEQSANARTFEHATHAFGLAGRSALVLDGGGRSVGMRWPELEAWVESADLLVNIGGHVDLEAIRDRIDCRAYVDIDPGFVQFWEAAKIPGAKLEGHDHYFTIGENIGKPDCEVPTLGLEWHAIRQPVVPAAWPVLEGADPERFTTVGSWRGSYGPIQFEGRTYGLKVHEFRRFIEMPRRAEGQFEIALLIHPDDDADLAALQENGWRVVDPRAAAGSPEAFRRYVQGSGAEFSVAQGIYVETRCGWFSDRSIRYLATGRPVLVQDTGLDGLLPVGEGLLTFRTMEEAVEGAARIRADHASHSRSARALAEEYFAPERALRSLLEVTGIRP